MQQFMLRIFVFKCGKLERIKWQAINMSTSMKGLSRPGPAAKKFSMMCGYLFTRAPNRRAGPNGAGKSTLLKIMAGSTPIGR